MYPKIAIALAVLVNVVVFLTIVTHGHYRQIGPVENPEPKIMATSTDKEILEKYGDNVICTDDCPLVVPEVVQEEVEGFFADAPVLADIAKCESTYRHFDNNGQPLKNSHGSSAIGVMQIMASYHEEPAKAMGYNINSLQGNLEYAKYLFEQKGTQPWASSKKCWSQYGRA